MSLARVYASSVHHVPEFVKNFDRAVSIAKDAGDNELIVHILVTLGKTLYRAGHPDKVVGV
jgi:hypothetical protein